MKWRVLPYIEQEAARNMATDEALLESIQNGGQSTIRLYSWQPSAVTIGTFQCRGDEVDIEAAKGVDVVRRMTGGGAVYHDRTGEITYSILAPQENFDSNIRKSYEEICKPIVEALQQLGIAAEFRPINDITVSGKKISGNAQTRRGGVLLQHGTILYDVDVDKMFSLLKVDKVKVSDKFVQSVKQVVTSVKQQDSDIGREDLLQSLKEAFTKGKKWEEGQLTDREKERASQLAEKYSSEEWNNSRV